MSTPRVARTDPCRLAATPPAMRYRARWGLRRRHTRRTRLSVPGVRLGTPPALVRGEAGEALRQGAEAKRRQLREVLEQPFGLVQPAGRRCVTGTSRNAACPRHGTNHSIARRAG